MRARRVDRVNTMQQRRRVWSPAQRRKCLTLLGFLGYAAIATEAVGYWTRMPFRQERPWL
jgi:hypothetical protein